MCELTVDLANDAHRGGDLQVRERQWQRVRVELSWPPGSQLSLRRHLGRCRRQFEAAPALLLQKNKIHSHHQVLIG